MKLGTFIMAALCAAAPAYADHLAMVQHYQRAYGEQPDPHLLTMIANEYRDAGKPNEALAYYCSYIFTEPAGDDADYASQEVHKLRPGVDSDHDACTHTPPVMHSEVDILAAMPAVPPVISKREIAGASLMALSIGAFALALHEGGQANKLNAELAALVPNGPRPPDADTLADRATSAENKEKWLLAAGGVTLVGGGIMYLIGRHDRLKAENVLVGPILTKRGGGLVLNGKF